jgi:hypothetical protein
MKNRLKNSADVACQIFCGWRLISSKAKLAELGSGSLEIHLLTGQCFFEGVPIDPLPISKELQLWFTKELAAQNITIETLKRASIRADIRLNMIPWAERTNKKEVFYLDGQALQTREMYRCIIECESEIEAGKASYTSRLNDIEEWPTGWPKPGSSCSKPV